MRRYLLAAVLLTFAILALLQGQSPNFTPQFFAVLSDPGNCRIGDFYFRLDSGIQKVCGTDNLTHELAQASVTPDVGNATGTTLTLSSYLQAAALKTATNCSSAASPAVCAAAPVGSVAIAADATTLVVATTKVTANSQILLTFDKSLGTKLTVTCNTVQPATFGVSARSPGTSFTISADASTVNPACFSYAIIN